MNNEYIINVDTMAIVAVSKDVTKIIETNQEIVINLPLKVIMDQSCKFFGSSLLGRQEGSKYLLGVSYKVPIIVDNMREFIFFPTTAVEKDNCCFISLNSLVSYKRFENGVQLCFKNDDLMLLSMSFGSFDNQYYHAIKLANILNKKKDNNE